MELNSVNRIKEFDKKLSSYGQRRFKFMIIPIFVLFTLCIDPMYKSEFPYHVLGVFNRGILIFINTLNFCTKEKINILYGLGVEVVGIENYFNETEDFKFMPKLKDLPEYKDVFYEYTKGEALIFGKKTFTFVVEYDDDVYKKEKARLSEDYEFYDIGEHDQFLYNRGIPENQFSVNSYNFKIMKSYKEEPFYYPNDLGMVGTSDEKHSIAYLYYVNYMRFNIEENWEGNGMDSFVKDVFKYDF